MVTEMFLTVFLKIVSDSNDDFSLPHEDLESDNPDTDYNVDRWDEKPRCRCKV